MKKPSISETGMETLEKLRTGKIKAADANAVTSMLSFFLRKGRLELDVLKFSGVRSKVAINKIMKDLN